MIRQLSKWLALALVGGSLIAGCGGGSKSTSSSQSSSTAAPATSSQTSSTPSTVPSDAAAVAQAVVACKAFIARATTLSAATKAKVEGICDKAAHGDLAGAKAAAKEVCAEVINASPIPGPAKEQALAACKRAS